jgi:hypothetical protein
MTPNPPVPGLACQDLMAHMQALCKGIGPRPPTSPQEYQAGEYVRKTLCELGLPEPGQQAFKSQNSIGWGTLPAVLMGALALPLAQLAGGPWGKLAGAALLALGLLCLGQMLLAIPPFYQPLIARWSSRNLFINLPPAGKASRSLFLVGHLDSQKQRFTAPIPWPRFQSALMIFNYLVGLVILVDLLVGAVLNQPGIDPWLWYCEGMFILMFLGMAMDEFQPHIEGANDNATAVSILLGMARALRDHPLRNTEVTLLFTGCEEVPCVGMEAYLKSHAIPNKNSYWIDLEMVGTGSLCYVTRHGMSPLGYYQPHPEMLRLARQAADKAPQLGVTGRQMVILEEVANLRRRDYQAICVAGYDQQGFLPNWHRLSDRLENIEPETLERAAAFTWALAQEVDGEAEKEAE